MASRTPATLWLPRLSATTVSPGRSAGASICSTQARKAGPSTALSSTSGASSPSARKCFFLGRQSWLARLPLQGGEVSGRVAAEAGSQGPRMAPSVETLAEISPAVLADAAQIAGGGPAQPRRRGRDQPHLAAQHGRGRGRPAPGRAALVVALRPEQLLEAVVGARQVLDGVAVEQPGSVAAGDLAEVLDGLGKMAR